MTSFMEFTKDLKLVPKIDFMVVTFICVWEAPSDHQRILPKGKKKQSHYLNDQLLGYFIVQELLIIVGLKSKLMQLNHSYYTAQKI